MKAEKKNISQPTYEYTLTLTQPEASILKAILANLEYDYIDRRIALNRYGIIHSKQDIRDTIYHTYKALKEIL